MILRLVSNTFTEHSHVGHVQCFITLKLSYLPVLITWALRNMTRGRVRSYRVTMSGATGPGGDRGGGSGTVRSICGGFKAAGFLVLTPLRCLVYLCCAPDWLTPVYSVVVQVWVCLSSIAIHHAGSLQ